MGLLTQATPMAPRSLVEAHDLLNLQAHSAFMQGQADIASDLYQQAVELSVQLLKAEEVSEAVLRLSVNACLNCFEFCPPPREDNGRHYLVLTATQLQRLVTGKQALAIRQAALMAYAEIARLGYYLTPHDASNGSSKVVEQFEQCWQDYVSQLMPDQ